MDSKMDSDEIIIQKERFMKCITPLNGIHNTGRVVFFDSIEAVLVAFINEHEDGKSIFAPMSVLDHNDVRNMKNCCRYHYQSGESGVENGFFEYGDQMVMLRNCGSGDAKTYVSVSSYNIAHFLCDYFNTESMCRELTDYVFNNAFWASEVVKTMDGKTDGVL